MNSIAPGRVLVAVALLLSAVLITSGVSFGFIQTILPLAFLGSAAMFCGFIAVAWSRDGH